jgi:hypothetical protein
MAIVTGHYPGLPTGPGEQLEFDITALDSLTVRQLMDFTQTCAAANKVAQCALLAGLTAVLDSSIGGGLVLLAVCVCWVHKSS